MTLTTKLPAQETKVGGGTTELADFEAMIKVSELWATDL
jgi:hypothetical protein